MTMTTSPAGRKLIETFEGLKLAAYQDQRGIWTIGYGHTGRDVYEGLVITPVQADLLLAQDLATAEGAVSRAVRVALSQNQFDALVSLTFNIGQTAFEHSTLTKLLNEEDFIGAANQFLVWDQTNKQVNESLLNRRNQERARFLS